MDFEMLDTAQSGERGMELLASREIGERCLSRPIACSQTYPRGGSDRFRAQWNNKQYAVIAEPMSV
jgi:hypothetical protein